MSDCMKHENQDCGNNPAALFVGLAAGPDPLSTALAATRRRVRGAQTIAALLGGVSTRTVHRYRRERGLPVWRTGGRGSPLEGELDQILAWQRDQRQEAGS